jgi:hypothetical protein
MGLLDRIQAKLELFHLEQRYTNRRNRRTAFISDAIYVDGEYVYASTNNTGSSSRSDQSTQSMQRIQSEQSRASVAAAKRRSVAAFPSESFADIETQIVAAREEGRDEAQGQLPQRRWSRNWGKARREEKRRSMALVRETRWEDGE